MVKFPLRAVLSTGAYGRSPHPLRAWRSCSASSWPM